MKKSRFALVLAMLFSVGIIGWSNVSYASYTCASASIERVGTNPTAGSSASPYFVQLDCSKDSVWSGTKAFYLSTDLGDSGLATLLTAYSLGKTIYVRTLGNTSGSIITIIYMND